MLGSHLTPLWQNHRFQKQQLHLELGRVKLLRRRPAFVEIRDVHTAYTSPLARDSLILLVAGTGFEPVTFGL